MFTDSATPFAYIALSELRYDILTVSHALGHSKPSTTLNEHGHWAPNQEQAPRPFGVEALDHLRRARLISVIDLAEPSGQVVALDRKTVWADDLDMLVDLLGSHNAAGTVFHTA